MENSGLSPEEIVYHITYTDDQGEVVMYSDGQPEVQWGHYSSFSEYYWPEDDPQDVSEYEKWAGRPTYWYAPLDWINFSD